MEGKLRLTQKSEDQNKLLLFKSFYWSKVQKQQVNFIYIYQR